MAKANNKNKKYPTDKEINERKLSFDVFIDQLEKNDFKVEEHKETVATKLELIRDEIMRYKGTNISYKIMCQHIEENVALKISEQSLRTYCQNNLGFPKGRKKNKGEKFEYLLPINNGDMLKRQKEIVMEKYDDIKKAFNDKIKTEAIISSLKKHYPSDHKILDEKFTQNGLSEVFFLVTKLMEEKLNEENRNKVKIITVNEENVNEIS